MSSDVVQCSMPLDPEQARKIFRIYRGFKTAKSGLSGFRKTRDMLDDHAAQTDVLMDAEGIVGRIRDKRVHPEDVRLMVRGGINSAPRIYGAVARHIRAKKAEANDG
jgi:hypothetical protein